MRLWIKLTLAMVAVSLAPLVVVSIQALDLQSDQALEARQAERSRQAVALAEEAGRWVSFKAESVRMWTILYPDLLVRSPAVQEGILRAAYRGIPGVVTVALLDEEGLAGPRDAPLQPLWLDASLSSEDPLADRQRGSSERAEAFLQRVPRPDVPGEVWLGEPYTPPAVAGVPPLGASLAVAARGPYAEPAILAVELALDELDAVFARRAVEGRGIALVNESGVPILQHGPSVDASVLKALLATPSAVFEDQGGRVGALAAVPGTTWAIVTTEPDAGDATWARFRLRLLVSLALSVLVAILAGVLVARTVSRPVAEVRDAANRIAEGDLEHRVPASGRDEIGELGSTFNRMAGRLSMTLAELEARRAEVEAFNEVLQDRVEARTRDLEAAQAELLRAGQLAAVAEVGAGLAHELNNPLASVLGVLQLVRARAEDGASPATLALLAQAEDQAQRCREVVDAMLRLSASEARSGAVRADLVTAVTEALSLVEGAAKRRGVALVVEEALEPGEVVVEAHELRRALTQLLQAIVAGLPQGAELRVGVRRDGESLVVVLTPDRELTTRDDFRAAGLGLWVARRVLAERGGELVAPGASEGLAWRVVLPAVTA